VRLEGPTTGVDGQGASTAQVTGWST